VDILQKLIERWEIDKITDLNDEAEKARDYLMKLPDRMMRLADRIKIPENSYQFKWVEPAVIK
jgi:acyl-[acyl-carrier-protein] desaturase